MGYSDNRPGCYGDEDYFDPDDSECKSCGVMQSCSVRASRAARSRPSESSRRSTTSATRSIQKTTPRKTQIEKIIEEPDDNATFGKILLHNTGLEVMQAVVDELGNSIRHIPRVDYGKYFERKKK